MALVRQAFRRRLDQRGRPASDQAKKETDPKARLLPYGCGQVSDQLFLSVTILVASISSSEKASSSSMPVTRTRSPLDST